MRTPAVKASLRRSTPPQLGVGLPNATSLAAMGVQAKVESAMLAGDSNWGILQIDFWNAFNSLSRADLLQEVGERCPEAAAWLHGCYGAHSPLYCQDKVLVSASGVQQGDPCGPAAFAWGIQPILEKLSTITA